MANTWTSHAVAVPFNTNTNLHCVINRSGTRVLRVQRIGLENSQTTSSTGVIADISIIRMTAIAGWTSDYPVTPICHDHQYIVNDLDEEIPHVRCGFGGTMTTTGRSDTFRVVRWSSDEPTYSSGLWDEWECMIPLNTIWDCGYEDSTCQPLVLRRSEAVYLYNYTAITVSKLDSWIEFTDEAS